MGEWGPGIERHTKGTDAAAAVSFLCITLGWGIAHAEPGYGCKAPIAVFRNRPVDVKFWALTDFFGQRNDSWECVAPYVDVRARKGVTMAVSVTDVHAFLCKHNALIVHFSGVPKMAGASTDLYPLNLKKVISCNGAWDLSASAIRPGDVFAPDPAVASASAGSLGIILAPRNSTSVKYVHYDDGGTIYDPQTGRRSWLPNHPAPSVQQMEDSFGRRTRYNEWIISDYEVKGLFTFRPIWLTPTQTIPLQRVVSDFPEMKVYTYSFDELIEITSASHSNLYP
jgi:hypothetical protein